MINQNRNGEQCIGQGSGKGAVDCYLPYSDKCPDIYPDKDKPNARECAVMLTVFDKADEPSTRPTDHDVALICLDVVFDAPNEDARPAPDKFSFMREFDLKTLIVWRDFLNKAIEKAQRKNSNH